MDLTVPTGGSSGCVEGGAVDITDANRDLGSMKRMLVFCSILGIDIRKARTCGTDYNET